MSSASASSFALFADRRLDLLCTLQAIFGLGAAVAGGWLAPQGAKGILIVYGLLLWRIAESARRHGLAARLGLLLASLLGAPLALPLTLWTWALLLDRKMRCYCDARRRGRTALEAAALAQGFGIAPRETEEARSRLRRAARLNRRAAIRVGVVGGSGLVVWAMVLADAGSRAFAPEWRLLLFAATALALFCRFFLLLQHRIDRGRSLGLHALVWTLLAPFSPRGAWRSHQILRDRRDLTPAR